MEKVKHKPPKIIREKHKAKESKSLFWKIFLTEASLFLLVSGLAVLCGFKLSAQPQKTFAQNFLLSSLFIVFFVSLFVVYKKADALKGLIYKGLLLLFFFWGGMVFLTLFFPPFGAVVVMGILMWVWIKFSKIWMHDLLMVLGLSGVVGFFGMGFAPEIVVAFLLIFSAYDFIAVYKTGHKALMEKEMLESSAIFGFVIPGKIENFKDVLGRVKPGSSFSILGGDNVLFPGLLAVSMIPLNPLKAPVIILFALAGLFLSRWMAGKSVIPTLPPIALFSIMGYFVTLFL